MSVQLRGGLTGSASIGAELHGFPIARPFPPPSERPPTGKADLLRKISKAAKRTVGFWHPGRSSEMRERGRRGAQRRRRAKGQNEAQFEKPARQTLCPHIEKVSHEHRHQTRRQQR